jgi:AraC-like DNA-binding protein
MKNLMNEKLSISETEPMKARFYAYERFTYPWHFHSEYEIIYFEEGKGTRFVGNNIEPFIPGEVLLIGPNLAHYMKSDEHQPKGLKGTIIQFSKDFMQNAIGNYSHFAKIKKLLYESRNGVVFSSHSNDNLYAVLNKIPDEKGINQIITLLEILKIMSENEFHKTLSTSEPTEISVSEHPRFDKVISFLNRNYNREIKLEEIASVAAMNPSAFCRYFRNKTGKTLKNYIAHMRTSYACKLLLTQNMNISQISNECGFETVSYFNKTFKEKTGYTPTEYKYLMLKS